MRKIVAAGTKPTVVLDILRYQYLLVVVVTVSCDDGLVELSGIEGSPSPLEVEQLDLDGRIFGVLPTSRGARDSEPRREPRFQSKNEGVCVCTIRRYRRTWASLLGQDEGRNRRQYIS